MTSPMSMSMRVDRPRERMSVTLYPRSPATWIPDARVKRCFHCNAPFYMMRRKHHCRSCGRIFCSACTVHRHVIPSYFRTYAPSGAELGTRPQRTCDDCSEQLERASDVEWLIRALARMPVTMRELFGLRVLNHAWNSAVNTLLSLYRGLQYKLSCQEYSAVEADFLETHDQEFNGHIQWQLHLLSSLRQRGAIYRLRPRTRAVRVPCRQLLCNKLCCGTMSVNDVLRLGITGCLVRPDVRLRVIATWRLFVPDVHLRMMFWWVHFSCQYPALFKDGLVPICLARLDLAYALWFELELQLASPRKKKTVDAALSYMGRRIKEPLRSEITASMQFSSFLKEAAMNSHKLQTRFDQYFTVVARVRLPWRPSIWVNGGRVKRRLMSSSRPVLIELDTVDGVSKEYLLKHEDVRTDRLAMTIGYWIQALTRVRVFTYDVFPLSQSCGCVEMVPEATTLYALRAEEKMSLLNYMMTHNPQLNVLDLRRHIIHSCTGACLLGFTLGVGDRHLENILVRKDAALIHVDFGYILGDDPKHLHTPMRITEDMVDAMGGRDSDAFRSFTLMSQQAYEILRLHACFWYHLLVAEYYVFEDKSRHWKRIRDHVLDRFVPGEWNDQASLHIESVIYRASESSMGQRFSDMTHAVSNHLNGLMFSMEL